MDFDFSDEQYMFQASVRDLLTRDFGIEQLQRGDTGSLWSGLAELGIFGMLAAEADGGLGLGFTDLALICEEFGRALVPASVTGAIMAGALVARHGTASQRGLLSALADGSAKLALAVADPLSGPAVTAERAGDGWRLSGRKFLVPEAAAADHVVVSALHDGRPALFLAKISQDGLRLTEQRTLDIASTWHALSFDAATAELLGEAPDPQAAAWLADAGAVVSALQMTGIAARMLDESVAYVGQRVQFGKVVGSFQAIKHRCADLAVDLEASRSAAYYAAWTLDHAAPSEQRRAASMAKAWSGDKSARACNEAIQLHGGTGFTWELGLHFFLRRAKVEQSLWGDASWHRERLMVETVHRMEVAE